MQRLEVTGAVRPLEWSLGVKGLKYDATGGKVFCSRPTCRSSFSFTDGGQSDTGATDDGEES